MLQNSYLMASARRTVKDESHGPHVTGRILEVHHSGVRSAKRSGDGARLVLPGLPHAIAVSPFGCHRTPYIPQWVR